MARRALVDLDRREVQGRWIGVSEARAQQSRVGDRYSDAAYASVDRMI